MNSFLVLITLKIYMVHRLVLFVLLCLKLDWNDIVEYTINKPWEKNINFSTQMLLDTFINKGYFNRDFFQIFFRVVTAR